MTIKTTLLAGILAASATASYGFPLTFTETLCTMDDQPLTENVDEFGARLTQVKRLETRGSAHRKHVEQHATELLSALDDATQNGKCSTQRKTRLEEIKAKFVKLD